MLKCLLVFLAVECTVDCGSVLFLSYPTNIRIQTDFSISTSHVPFFPRLFSNGQPCPDFFLGGGSSTAAELGWYHLDQLAVSCCIQFRPPLKGLTRVVSLTVGVPRWPFPSGSLMGGDGWLKRKPVQLAPCSIPKLRRSRCLNNNSLQMD